MNFNNMGKMMKQMKKMQQEMEKTQEELAKKTVEGSAGGEMVKVTVNGDKRLVDVQIKPEAVDPEDIEMLQDLVLAATNDALKKMNEMTEKEMGKFTKGMNLPGF
jgi:DNA-binding YbaB/EbfC family protein